MKKLYKVGNENLILNRASFSAAINAWSRSKDPNALNKARHILDEMKRLEASGDTDCSPNIISYNSLLKVVVMSNSKDKAVEAWDILSEMDERGIEPDEIGYSTTLMACAFYNRFDLPTREVAFQIALQTIQRAHAEAKELKVAYSFFFEAAAGLGHDDDVKNVYSWCCNSGFQDDESLRSVMREGFPNIIEEGYTSDANEEDAHQFRRLKSVIHECASRRDGRKEEPSF